MRITGLVCGLIAGFSLSPWMSGNAAPITWNGNTSTDFTDGSNWTGGVAPMNNLTTDIATFSVRIASISTVAGRSLFGQRCLHDGRLYLVRRPAR